MSRLGEGVAVLVEVGPCLQPPLLHGVSLGRHWFDWLVGSGRFARHVEVAVALGVGAGRVCIGLRTVSAREASHDGATPTLGRLLRAATTSPGSPSSDRVALASIAVAAVGGTCPTGSTLIDGYCVPPDYLLGPGRVCPSGTDTRYGFSARVCEDTTHQYLLRPVSG